MSLVTSQSSVAVSPGVAACPLQGEMALLHIASGRYFGLDPVGARIWELLEARPHTVSEVQAALLEEFEVEPDRCLAEVCALLDQLSQLGLVEVTHVPAALAA